MQRVIRDAAPEDAAACAAIYRPYVDTTSITFETEAPDAVTMAARIAAAQQRHAYLVCEDDCAVIGYAFAHEFAERAAYRWSCELSVYVDPDHRRTGAGRDLYTALIERLADRGLRRAVARIAVPNESSIALHEAFGFTSVGRFPRIGWKHGRWHDVEIMQRDLGDGGDPTAPVDR
jgi:L-amino acid N-acyltransferase YncA